MFNWLFSTNKQGIQPNDKVNKLSASNTLILCDGTVVYIANGKALVEWPKSKTLEDLNSLCKIC